MSGMGMYMRRRTGPGVNNPQAGFYSPYQQQQPGFYRPDFQGMAAPSLDYAQVQAHQSQTAQADPRGPIQRGIGDFLSNWRNRIQDRVRSRQGVTAQQSDPTLGMDTFVNSQGQYQMAGTPDMGMQKPITQKPVAPQGQQGQLDMRAVNANPQEFARQQQMAQMQQPNSWLAQQRPQGMGGFMGMRRRMPLTRGRNV